MLCNAVTEENPMNPYHPSNVFLEHFGMNTTVLTLRQIIFL